MTQQTRNLPPDWKIKWRLVSKAEATRWLAKRHSNRDLNESVVDAYRRVIDAKLWDQRPSQSPIAIDKNGNLINGQHRLHAFLNSKAEFLMLPVITGCEPEDYLLFDQDIYLRSRAAQFQGKKYVTRDMARVRALEVLQTGDPRRRIPNSLYEFLSGRQYAKELSWASEVFSRTGDQQRAPFVAAFMYVYRVAPALVSKIAGPWVNGGEGLPALLIRVRDNAIRERGAGGNWEAMNSSLRMLNALMYLHGDRQVPRRVDATMTGLNYWSGLAKDGVAEAWARIAE